MDIFEKMLDKGPLGKYQEDAHGYFAFPKLEGEIGPRMKFNGKEVLTWSLNNYLGFANHPEIRKVDAEAAKEWGLAYPMGARMLSGQTKYHEKLELDLAHFVGKPDGYLLNYGYQGMISIIDSLATRKDVIVYDSESHACIIDGIFLHKAKGGKSFVFPHNDIERCAKMLKFAKKNADENGGGILVITEGVFGMAGDLGKLDKIAELKKEFEFRFLVDDAHGFGTMGKTGAGTPEHFGVTDQVDLYFSTFAKAMAGIGGFIAGPKYVIDNLRYNMRSQVYAKSLPMPMVFGAMKRLEMLKNEPQHREKLWTIVHRLQSGFKENGFNIRSESPVTPVFLQGSVEEATHLNLDIREHYNVFLTIVIYPIVPKDVIMLRIIPTAVHTIEDVDYTIDVFKKVKSKLVNHEYPKDRIADIKSILKS